MKSPELRIYKTLTLLDATGAVLDGTVSDHQEVGPGTLVIVDGESVNHIDWNISVRKRIRDERCQIREEHQARKENLIRRRYEAKRALLKRDLEKMLERIERRKP